MKHRHSTLPNLLLANQREFLNPCLEDGGPDDYSVLPEIKGAGGVDDGVAIVGAVYFFDGGGGMI